MKIAVGLGRSCVRDPDSCMKIAVGLGRWDSRQILYWAYLLYFPFPTDLQIVQTLEPLSLFFIL
jgi:hypothetical protein